MYDFFELTVGERMFGHKFDDSMASRGITTEHPSPVPLRKMSPPNAVIRSRDVSFDDDVFYDPAQLDLGHTLREDVSHVI
jgi:hypothetical protein